MLDRQVQLKKNREMNKRIQEFRQDQFENNFEKPAHTAYNNKTIDTLPHEWNDPGMRYLRKSMSSINRPNEHNSPPATYSNISVLNKSHGNMASVYNSGKKTMLEPLQNGEYRKDMRKEMNRNYKQELDQQCARKEVRPQDLLDNYQQDDNLAIHNEHTQAFPINSSGTFLADQDYDNAIKKFFARESLIDSNFISENYDDDVFKRRDLRSKLAKVSSNFTAYNL